MGADHQVLVVNHEITDRTGGKVLLQRLPMIPVVSGKINRPFRTRIKQTGSDRVFPDHVDRAHIRHSIGYFLPGCPSVMGAVNVRTHVVLANGVDSDVSGL